MVSCIIISCHNMRCRTSSAGRGWRIRDVVEIKNSYLYQQREQKASAFGDLQDSQPPFTLDRRV
eukprot:3916670-Heterocapsa_arctica.AAC.1